MWLSQAVNIVSSCCAAQSRNTVTRHSAHTLLLVLLLNRALTSRSATSSRWMAPHTLLSSVKTPLPVAGCVFKPPGLMIVNCMSPPMLCIVTIQQLRIHATDRVVLHSNVATMLLFSTRLWAVPRQGLPSSFRYSEELHICLHTACLDHTRLIVTATVKPQQEHARSICFGAP